MQVILLEHNICLENLLSPLLSFSVGDNENHYRRLWSLTIKSIEDHCGCLHGLKAGPENLLDNHIYLRHIFYDLQQHFTDLQKPEKARGSRIRMLKSQIIRLKAIDESQKVVLMIL